MSSSTHPRFLTPHNLDGSSDLGIEFTDCAWLRAFRRIDVRGKREGLRNADFESLCVVLDGTHDLYAGGGTWSRRGVRATPFEGRPVALYLPPMTTFGCSAGDGTLLVASVAQPPLTEALDARERLARKPLLPLLGSGKAFDPQSGEWKTRESFPDSPEALLPRRVQRSATRDGAAYERILPLDYKARGLCADEAALQRDTSLRFEPPVAMGYPSECALWLELDGVLDVDGERVEGHTPRALWCERDRIPSLTLREGRAYVLAVYAGTKPA